jgi:hypothetical protein
MCLAVTACGVSPISHHIAVGEESFVAFVGEGRDGHTDLFAVPAGGGEVSQLTFTSLLELAPTLTREGDRIAFLRMTDTMPGTPAAVVVMDLVSGNERQTTLAPEAGRPSALAWSDDERTVLIRTDHGLWQLTTPPDDAALTPVPTDHAAAADSLLTLWLGQPRFARPVPCAEAGLCVIGPAGDTSELAPAGRDPIRWGDDSVAWFEEGALLVRSLGPGRARRLAWKDPPLDPRAGSYAEGVSATDGRRTQSSPGGGSSPPSRESRAPAGRQS